MPATFSKPDWLGQENGSCQTSRCETVVRIQETTPVAHQPPPTPPQISAPPQKKHQQCVPYHGVESLECHSFRFNMPMAQLTMATAVMGKCEHFTHWCAPNATYVTHHQCFIAEIASPIPTEQFVGPAKNFKNNLTHADRQHQGVATHSVAKLVQT
jgi:hypothetical protein